MARYKRLMEQKDGWAEWVNPKADGYKMSCCDCGLVHDLEFQIVKILEATEVELLKVKKLDSARYTVIFRARRNHRATAQMRRHNRR